MQMTVQNHLQQRACSGYNARPMNAVKLDTLTTKHAVFDLGPRPILTHLSGTSLERSFHILVSVDSFT